MDLDGVNFGSSLLSSLRLGQLEIALVIAQACVLQFVVSLQLGAGLTVEGPVREDRPLERLCKVSVAALRAYRHLRLPVSRLEFAWWDTACFDR